MNGFGVAVGHDADLWELDSGDGSSALPLNGTVENWLNAMNFTSTSKRPLILHRFSNATRVPLGQSVSHSKRVLQHELPFAILPHSCTTVFLPMSNFGRDPSTLVLTSLPALPLSPTSTPDLESSVFAQTPAQEPPAHQRAFQLWKLEAGVPGWSFHPLGSPMAPRNV